MANTNPKQSQKTIVKLLLILDSITLFVSFFSIFKGLIITILSINVFFLGFYMIFEKFSGLVEANLPNHKLASKVDKRLGKMNG